MLEPRWSKPAPGAIVPLPLIPAFADSPELHTCDLRRLVQELAALDAVSRAITAARKRLLPLERSLAGYLMTDTAARAELVAATESPLRRHASKGQRGLADMAARSTFDTAVLALPLSQVMRLDVEGLTAIARRASGAPLLQLRIGDVRTVRDAGAWRCSTHRPRPRPPAQRRSARPTRHAMAIRH